ncbi:MAG: hypothetical protein JW797_15870 [Bradymonadales bacterium]|nr:hypothetical protein [Bradymonadales bacterium]
MGVFIKSQHRCCNMLALIALAALGSSCGLNKREAYLADTNSQIQVVYELSEHLAREIYNLPDQLEGSEDFQTVTAAYQAYRLEVNRLNQLIHRLCEVIPELNEHLRTAFDPTVAEALTLGDDAVAVFQQPAAERTDYQNALTQLCLSIERYAGAVTALSREYARLMS